MAIYRTIKSEATGLYRDRGSKFVAYAIPAASIEVCHTHIARIIDEHQKARHWCYAYRIGPNNEQYREFDDGEPSGTAGRPIAQQIESFNLTNIIVVVVRYFGRKLLGTSGLITAYKSTAYSALSNAEVVEKEEVTNCKLRFHYAIMGKLLAILKKSDDIEVLSKDFSATPSLIISIPKESFETRLENLLMEILGVHEVELESPLIFADLEVEILQDE